MSNSVYIRSTEGEKTRIKFVRIKPSTPLDDIDTIAGGKVMQVCYVPGEDYALIEYIPDKSKEEK